MDTIKKIICLCTVLTIVSSFASCSNQQKTQTLGADKSYSSLPQTDTISNTTSKIKTYYDEIPIDVSEDFDSISQIKFFDNKLYVLGRNYSSKNYSAFSTDLDTLQTVEIQNDSISSDTDENIFTDKNGNTYKFYDNKIDVSDKNQKHIKKISPDSFGIQEDVSTLNFDSAAVSENGDIYIAASLKTAESIQIIKLNSSFEIQYITEKGIFSDCGNNIIKIFIGTDGNPVLCTESDMTYINIISQDSGRTTLRYEIKDCVQIIGGYGSSSIIYRNQNDIFLYDYVKDNSKKLYTADSNLYEISDTYIKDGSLITNQRQKYNSNILSIMTPDGKTEKKVIIPTENNINNMFIFSDGIVYFFINNCETEVTDNNYSQTTQPEILYMKNDGTIETRYKTEEKKENMEYHFAADSLGNICLSKQCYFDEDDKLTVTYISHTGEQTDMTYDITGPVYNLLCLNDQFIIQVKDIDSISSECLIVDNENMTINNTEDINIPCDKINNIIDGNNGYDFYYPSSNGVYGYHTADCSSEIAFSWFESDISWYPRGYQNIAVADSENIFYYNESNMDSESGLKSEPVSIIHMKKADEERLKELNKRNIITFAGVDIDQYYFSKIKQFNKNNTDCMIMATDYLQYDPQINVDNKSSLNNLLKDIEDSNIPDVIIGNRNFDIQKLLSKGMLTDLNDLITNDPETDNDDLARNVLDACTYNGMLYCIPDVTTISSLVMPDECVDNKEMLTYDEFFSLSEKFNDKPFVDSARERVFKLLISSYVSDYVDFHNSTCNFQTDNFRKILEKLKECIPQDLNSTEGYYTKCNGQIISDSLFRVNSLNDLYYLYDDLADADSNHVSYSLKGIPSLSGTTSLMNIESYLCIPDLSQDKDDAWKCIKNLINTDKIDNIDEDRYTNKLSVSRSKNQETIDKIISGMSGSVEEQRSHFSQSDMDNFKNELTTLCSEKIISCNSLLGILSIITEQSDKYFNDTQTLDQTVSDIQNKVMLYLSEIQ